MAFNPLSGQVTAPGGLQVVNEVLTNVAKQYRPQGYIYDRLVAPQLVNYNFGLYPVFNPAQFFSTGGNLAVSDRAPTPKTDFEWSTSPYACVDYRLAASITRKEMAQAHPAVRLDYSKTVGLLTQFATNRENRLATALQSTANGGQLTANGGNPVAPTVKWDQGTTSTPATIQQDLQGAALLVMKASGVRPNTLVIDYQVAYAIAADPGIKDYIKYLIGTQALADGVQAILPSKLFGFNVVIADGTLMNTGRPGDANATLSGIWGNKARLLYVNPNAQWGIPSVVYAFRGRVAEGVGDAQPPAAIMPTGQGGQEPGPAGSWAVVDQWWDIDPPVLNIRAWECVDERVVAPELGIEIGPVLNAPVY
jgi:hypothetical protein